MGAPGGASLETLVLHPGLDWTALLGRLLSSLKIDETTSQSWNVAFYYFTTIPLFEGLIYRVARDTSVISRVLSSPLLQLLGNASFALYWMHWLVLEFVIESHMPFGLWHMMALMLGLSGASVVMHLWFEKPVRQWVLGYFKTR